MESIAPALRQRKNSANGRQSPRAQGLSATHPVAPYPPLVETLQENGSLTSKLPSWRFLVRWTARFFLVVLLFLSSAKVVRIPPPEPVGDGAQLSQKKERNPGATTVLLVMAHARPDYLRRCLNSVLKNAPTWPVVVSIDCQDGDVHEDVREVVSAAQTIVRSSETNSRIPSLSGDNKPVHVWHHDMSYPQDRTRRDANDEPVSGQDEDPLFDVRSYRRIARHYRWALKRAFAIGGVERVVVLEDDMEVASDFFPYFNALSPLLDSDPSLFCISAWNDNGKAGIVSDPEQLHRTDFFPGLGWMLSRSTWEEFKPKWPEVYWDDWLRSEQQTHGRQCIRPEVSRTSNFGADGVSQSFNYDKHVSKVVLNERAVNFSAIDLNYLNPEAYEKLVFGRMSRAVLLKYSNYLSSKPQDADVIARYPPGNMDAIGKRTGIMTDHREGVFRTSYRGVVIFPWNGHWAFIVPRGWEPPVGKNYSLGASECCGR